MLEQKYVNPVPLFHQNKCNMTKNEQKVEQWNRMEQKKMNPVPAVTQYSSGLQPKWNSGTEKVHNN